MENDYLLLTGATGHLGQHLLRELLRARRPTAVLVRRSRFASGRQRVEEVLRRFEKDAGRLLPRPVVIEGDLSRDDLGLDDAWRAWLRMHCGTVLHSAAVVVFDRHTTPKRDVFLNNVGGTQRLLELCRETAVRQFHYVSSAFSCGLADGVVTETPHDDAHGFRNDYERSKQQAEAAVRGCGWIDPPTIYRPSIIVGDLETGRIPQEQTIYNALLVMAQWPAEFGRPNGLCRTVGMTGAEGKNLVPADWVARAVVRLLGKTEARGRTFHLTNPRPTPVGEIEAGFLKALTDRAAGGSTAAGRSNRLPPTAELPQLTERFVSVFAPYFAADPTFDVSNTAAALPDDPCPAIGLEELAFLGGQYLAQGPSAARGPAASLPPVLDRLHEIADADADGAPSASAVELCLVGPGGGNWMLSDGDDGPRLTPGATHSEFTVFGQADTFAAVVAGRASLSDAVRQGRLAVWSADATAGLDQLRDVAARVRAVLGIGTDGPGGTRRAPVHAGGLS